MGKEVPGQSFARLAINAVVSARGDVPPTAEPGSLPLPRRAHPKVFDERKADVDIRGESLTTFDVLFALAVMIASPHSLRCYLPCYLERTKTLITNA